MVPGMHSHLELQWQLPGYRRFVRGLSRHSRLIRYDKLGTGLSDPTISSPTVGERVDDLAAVAAACAASAPFLLGFSEGGPLAIRFAEGHRASGLVLYGTSVRPPTSEARAELDLVLRGWGSGRSLDTFAPSLAADPAARRITASLERAASECPGDAASGQSRCNWCRPSIASLAYTRLRWVSIVARDRNSSRATAGLLFPSAASMATRASASVRDAHPVSGRVTRGAPGRAGRGQSHSRARNAATRSTIASTSPAHG